MYFEFEYKTCPQRNIQITNTKVQNLSKTKFIKNKTY